MNTAQLKIHVVSCETKKILNKHVHVCVFCVCSPYKQIPKVSTVGVQGEEVVVTGEP